jgi:hypothetical protein
MIALRDAIRVDLLAVGCVRFLRKLDMGGNPISAVLIKKLSACRRRSHAQDRSVPAVAGSQQATHLADAVADG